jgi:hypothetical protein
MKINIKKLTPLMLVLLLQAEASSITYGGSIRTGVQYHDRDDGVGYDSALGVSLHLEKIVLSGITMGLRLDTTQVLFGQHDAKGVAFFSSDAESYALLSESYLETTIAKNRLKIGRQRIDTPFADSDDIGMVANRFEAFTLTNYALADTIITYTFLKKFSGVDATTPEYFSAINGGSGVHAVGILYEGLEDLSYAMWFYHMPHRASFWYGESSYSTEYAGLDYQVATQVAWQDFKGGACAKVVGFMARASYQNIPLSLHLAYNKSFDESAENGFGGGPFFANDEHMTLADVGADGMIAVYGVEWDITSGLNIGLFRADLEDAKGAKGEEFDIVATYNYHDRLTFDAIYSTLDNSKISGDKFDNLRVFAKYSF